MKTKITKEFLTRENVRLMELNKAATDFNAHRKQQADALDKERRTEFAKAFGWKKSTSYNNDEYRNPTWEEIFVHVGRLLASQQFHSQENEIDNLHSSIQNLERRIFPLEKQ